MVYQGRTYLGACARGLCSGLESWGRLEGFCQVPDGGDFGSFLCAHSLAASMDPSEAIIMHTWEVCKNAYNFVIPCASGGIQGLQGFTN
eukprot:1161838-Pelagomonas_calceolata.AAC.9